MPQFTILNVKDDLAGLIHSGTLTKVTNPNSVFQRAARNLLSRINPAGTKRITQITNALHDEIFDYTAPVDLKGNNVLDIRPQHSRHISENYTQRLGRRFDLYKRNETFTIRDNSMTKSLRASVSILKPTTLHEMNSLTQNGDWAVGGDATNLTADTLNFISGNASLNFDLTGSAVTGYIENSTMTAVDISTLENIAKIFVRVYIPDPSIITNWILRWGSSASAYWTATVTRPHDQTTFKTGWNILAFDWNGATKTGSPDSSAINYLRVTVTVSVATAETDLRVDKISASSGEIWEIAYYSKYLFQTTAGVWQETTTEDSDYVNLDTDEINLFEYECLMAIGQQLQGKDGAFDIAFAREMLGLSRDGRIIGGLYADYLFNHPDETIRPRSVYYNVNLYNKRRR